ncbi:MAG: saccharopine dehydrogenase NADP-binding domain-containing protein [Pyrinomonadaceae bacterium]|nr:saccharopine dehydrogenase NADP-binding domain-containing protein [Pyrinomonadaceae bacterium]
MSNNFLIYGANGYTGELITRFAADRGLKPIIAGRNEAAIKPIAEKYGFEFRTFALDETEKLDAALNEVAMVLHCAGPFSLTSKAMGEACLRTKTHYTDITGEIAVFEACAAADQKAKDAGIMVMPGVGFDVVPSDCLAMHLKDRLPSATNLTLAWYGMGRMSHGTQATMTMNVGKGGAVRRDGKIMPVPAAWRTREFDFGNGVVKTGVTIPWGDVSTAYHSTGIPNIEVYSVIPGDGIRLMKISRYLGWLLATKFVQKYLQRNIPPGGPSDHERMRGKTLLWGEASDDDGNRVEARMQAPEGYTVTAIAALNIAEKILAGNFTPGFQTPAKAYGADLILEVPGVELQDT